MPQAVAVWAGTAILSATGSSVAGAYLASAVAVAAYAGTAYGLTAGVAKLSANQAPSGGIGTRDVTVGAGKVPQIIVYGEAWVGGALLYSNSRHDSGTKDNFTFYRKVARTSHEVNAITDLMFDDNIVTDASDIDWGAGHITAGTYGLVRSGVYAVDLEKTLGTGTETQSPLLSAAFAADYDGSGDYTTPGWATTTIAYRYFSKTAKNAEGIFYSGPPSRELAKVQGYKVYDPRKDSTFSGGSGSQRLATPSTWVYSTNPALQAAHYLMIYMDVASTRINWTWIAAQADICDHLVVIPPAASPSHREARFSGNGVVSLGNSHLQNLEAILSSMLGTLSKPSGTWQVNAAAYQTPDVSITDADIIGDPQLKGGFGLADRYNSVTGIYIEPNAYAEEVDSLPITDAGFVTRDGGFTLPTTINLPFTNGEYQAQRLAYMHLAQSDRQKTFVIGVKWIGLAVTIGTRVSVTFGKFSWNTKPFRCVGWKKGDNAPFELTLREDDSAVWDDPPIGAYSTRDAHGAVTTGTVEIPSPTAGAANGETTVQNANFEAGDFYWGREGSTWTIANDPTNAHQGEYVASYSGTHSGASPTIGRFRNYVYFPCKPGMRVTFGGYVKTDLSFTLSGFATYGAAWSIIWADSAKVDISAAIVSNPCVGTGVAWYAQRGTAVAPANTQFVLLNAVVDCQTGGTAYFDDSFMLVETGGQLGDNITDSGGTVVTDDDALNALQVQAIGAVNVITQDSAGAWPAGNPTYDLVATFKRDGSTIATRTVRFSLTTATGVITVASLSSTGETTTYAETGDPSSGTGGIIYATITHTASNVATTLVVQQNIFAPASGGGGIGK